jgi:hypothetical protein
MEDLNYLSRLDRAAAPSGFEQGALARLALRRRSRRRQRVLRYSLAGASAAFLACLVLFNFVGLRKNVPNAMAGLEKDRAAVQSQELNAMDSELIPVLETAGYFDKIRPRSIQPETVYLLEQVSYTSQKGIKY